MNDLTLAIKDTNEYKLAMFKRCIKEIKNRFKYKYYTYKPLRVGMETEASKYSEFHKCGRKIRILTGAPRSGKTTMAIQDVLWLALGEHPFVKMETPNLGWVIVQKKEKIVEPGGMLDKFKEVLPMNRVVEITSNEKRGYCIEFNNGSRIVFKSEEQGIDSFTSNKIHWALKDERIYNDDIRNQLRVRILDKDGLLIYTMDKLEEDVWVDDLITSSKEQEKLGRKGYVFFQSYTLRDNPLIPEAELDRMETELDEIDKEKIYYGRHKERGLVYKFPKSIWNESNFVEINPRRYDIIMGEWVENEQGSLRVYKDKIPNSQYIMAWDVGEGVGKNSHAIQIFDETGEQIAMWLNNTLNYNALDKEILIPLGNYYNNALAAGELRSYGHAVMKGMVDSEYPNMYVDIINKNLKQIRNSNLRFGVVTDEVNKSEMVEQTLSDILNCKLIVHCEKTKKQLDNFVMDVKDNRDYKYKGKSGIKYHGTRIKDDPELKNSDDDLVMSLFFADRALNAYDYLKNIDHRKTKSVVKTIDDIKPSNAYERYLKLNPVITGGEYEHDDFWYSV